MNSKFLKVSLGLVAIALSVGASAAEWNYQGDINANWSKLGVCGTGKQQSPINLTSVSPDNSLTSITRNYRESELVVINNGHTIEVEYHAGSSMKVNGETYNLVQFHFHTPSENKVNGYAYPMEMHLVHKSSAGVYAVLGVMLRAGSHNEAMQDILDNAPRTKGTNHTTESINVSSLLPSSLQYLKWDGSLTTPTCDEGVKWHLANNTVQISSAQIAQFQSFYAMNARPTQPLNGRVVRVSAR